MSKKILALLLSGAFILGGLAGCGKSEESTETVDTTSLTDLVAESDVNAYSINISSSSKLNGDATDVLMMKDGMVMSDLTGEWIDASLADKRYFGIMVNNISEAMPQSGVARADVIYEILEEGGITRLLAIYQGNYEDIERIGPVRSARHYFDRKALEYDAIFVHWGHSIYAGHEFEVLTDLDDIDLNGKDGGQGFRVSRPGKALEHTGYTSGANIAKAIENDGFDTNKSSSYKKMFAFNVNDKVPEDGTDANKITTAFNDGRKPWFQYDAESGLYKRFQYGDAQIDELTGEQLAFKNVIVQFAPHQNISGDSVGCIDVDLVGEGEGWYATDGKIIPIKWKKEAKYSMVNFKSTDGMLDYGERNGQCSDYGVTTYYTMDGERLKMNPGKTWITLLQDNNKDGVIVE